MDPTQDRDSPEAVIRRYSDMVYRLAFARTGNRSDAEDLYQEVFLRYLTKAPAFTSEDHRKAWLLRVAVNCANRFHTAPDVDAPPNIIHAFYISNLVVTIIIAKAKQRKIGECQDRHGEDEKGGSSASFHSISSVFQVSRVLTAAKHSRFIIVFFTNKVNEKLANIW